MSADPLDYPKPTAQVEPFVEILGVETAVRFLLRFGGAELYLAQNPGPNSKVVRMVGRDKAIALSKIDHRLQRRVPLAKQWMAQYLRSQDMSVAEIARTIRASDISVRAWIKDRKPDSGLGKEDWMDV